MRFSGEVFDSKPLGNTFTVDKHSTGGVGDKSSLLIAPVLAAAGLEGTPSDLRADDLRPFASAIPAARWTSWRRSPASTRSFRSPRMTEVLRECHAVMMGQTPRLVPADRILYALRDHTGTVESPYPHHRQHHEQEARRRPARAGAGCEGRLRRLHADVRSLEASRATDGRNRRARRHAHRRAAHHMDEPLGRFSGNWVEVWECVDILKARTREARHPMSADLIELSNVALRLDALPGGQSATPEAGAQLADELMLSGAAYDAWCKLTAAQGGDISRLRRTRPRSISQRPRACCTPRKPATSPAWTASRSAGPCSVWARAAPSPATRSARTPASSRTPSSATSSKQGQPIFTLFSEDEALLDEPYRMLEETVRIADAAPACTPLIREVVQREALS